MGFYLLLQRMKNQLLVSFNGSFKISNGQVLPRAMCNKNVSWTVEVPRVVTFEVGNVGSVVYGNFLKAWTY